MKGLIVNTYRNAGGDCTNGGVTTRHDDFILVDPTTDLGPFEVTEKDIEAGRVLMVGSVCIGGKKHFHAFPYGTEQSGKAGPRMFGGNMVATSDSRFRERFGTALNVHDRFESWEQYNRMD